MKAGILRGLIPAIVLSCAAVMLSACERPTDDDRYVVIISIDGFPAWSLWDERIPLPALRELAREGAFARSMTPSTPSVTWPNHTTLVTGVHPERHGVLANGMIVRSEPGEPVRIDGHRDKDELVAVPTLYDVAHAAGLRTAEVNWPCTRNAATIDYGFPDVPNNVTHTTPWLRRELVRLGLLEEETDAALFRHSAVGRDVVWTGAATHLIRERRPNLLLVHLLNVDGTHHEYGVDSGAGFTALAQADRNVRDVLDALEDAGIRDRTAILVVSDHGFINVTQFLHPNVLFREAGLLDVDDEGRITRARIQMLSLGGSAIIYTNEPTTAAGDLEIARRLLQDAEGIARILEPGDFAEHGLPHPSDDARMGELFLAAEDGYAFNGSASGVEFVLPGNRGVHGYPGDYPRMASLFVASGRGVRAGAELDVVDNRSVAPTAARLLGLTLAEADGEVLDAILE